MSKEIKIEIHIDGNAVTHFNHISIQQAFNTHHNFELVLDHDSLEELGRIPWKVHRNI